MDLDLTLPNALGFCGLCLTIYSFQRKHTRQIFFTHIFSGTFWALHFFTLGAFAGAAINTCNILKATAFVYLDKRHFKKFICIYIPILWGLFLVFVYNQAIDLLPLISSTIGTMIIFVRDNRYIVARLSCLCALLWLVYGAMSGSIPSVLTEIFILSSVLIGMIRHEDKPFKLFRHQ